MTDSPANAPETKPPLHILCTDDEEFVLYFYQTVLAEKGYKVSCCHNGQAALTWLETQLPDLLLLDIEMPGMTGLEVLDRLRKDLRCAHLPILIVSSDSSETTVERGLTMGADDYLVKPVKAGELLAKVSTALRKRSLSGISARGLPLGALLGGRYDMQETLGEGGFSTVYRALDTLADPPATVAIKLFPPERVLDQRFLSRFLREAYSHCRLRHAHIVGLLDFGQSNGVYYLAMEYLDGMNLDQIVEARGAMEEGLCAMIAMDVLGALGYLDEHGLVHRDIKPRNIMITSEGETKLLDFGLARSIGEETLSTTAGALCGTPLYVSPEYIRSADMLDIRSDVYSLGVTMYYVLTQHSPFPPASAMEVLHHHLQTPPEPIATYLPDIEPAFGELIDSMLIKDRDARPRPQELRARLKTMLTMGTWGD